MGNTHTTESKFMRMGISSLAHQLPFSKAQIKELYVHFHKAVEEHPDSSSDAVLSEKQFTAALAKCEFCISSHQVLHELFQMFDKKNTGYVTFKEFCVGLAQLMGGDSEDTMFLAFEAYDTNASGFLEPDEIKTVLLTLNLRFKHTLGEDFDPSRLDEMVQKILEIADVGNKGKLSLAEYEALCQSTPCAA